MIGNEIKNQGFGSGVFGLQGCGLVGGVSGFYYSLYAAAEVRGLSIGAEPEAADATKYGPVLCGADSEVEFREVKKPSEERGFFTIRVGASPSSAAVLNQPGCDFLR